MVFDRYEIQSKPTEETCSVNDDDEHERCDNGWFVDNDNNNNIVMLVAAEEGDAQVAIHNYPTSCPQPTATEALSKQPVDVVTQHQQQQEQKSCSSQVMTFLQYTGSVLLLLFSLAVVVAAIVTKQTAVAKATHPIVALALLAGLLLWLGLLEGGQGCIVGLQHRDAQRYAQSHPWTFRCTQATAGRNLERFIVGRQFLVVLVVFGINLCGSSVADADVLGLPPLAHEIFLASGVALMLVTIVIGQLAAQVNSATCLLDFINYRLSLMTVWAALAVEQSGLLHACYLVQMLFSRFTDKRFDSGSLSRCSKFWFWLRVVLSLAVLGFAFAVTLTALFDGQTTMWEGGIPAFASVIIFLLLVCFVGFMEGMQIALFSVVNLREEDSRQHPVAFKNCQLVFRDQNFQAVLIGRQICVTICMFLVARITTIAAPDDERDTVLGVPSAVQDLFQTGLLGALITTIVGSLAWRVVASSFPLAFLSNPLIYLIIRLCLLLEASSVCTAAWILAALHKHGVGLQNDSIYLGNEEATKDASASDAEASQREDAAEC